MSPSPRLIVPRLIVLLAVLPLSACGKDAPPAPRSPFAVLTQKAEPQSFDSDITLTGTVRAQIQSELSFRISGRVIERKADVGQHVTADEVLARLDPTEQQADLKSAEAGLAGAEATMRQADAAFARQKALLANGYATQAAFDLAERAQRTAAGSLDVAKAQVTTAQDALSYTYLRAGHPGMITARNIEVGQVAQAAQMAFTLAQDGPRDAVFAVYESAFARKLSSPDISLVLVSDPSVKTSGRVREISPVVDEKTGTVQVKVQIDAKGPDLPLGAAVTGSGRLRLDNVFVLPWTALSSKDGKPALWVVDPADNSVHLRPVAVAFYVKERVVLRGGLKPGESVVTEGGKFLREGQIVAPRSEERS
ncbi:efflux RND transporter periplasmic adaptor subunit [Rhodoblastus acidophilus]|uniref:Efflux RND transporter periplasmic adaptor subunit n=1 Tax=Candidatus Rhodoblastus alkanivorans TaxID=2954117 RepID=A0ABS9ZAM3_9HYPH|nr:efflux RND transporter periplasmic adaptor subunit [Candidatus Rhodoblastus alkanivorans]MCI4677758.1 efflux RND transporter periplasmic adaptor subunit [Candidatus Rhodoblastus alkanivorans]MCI4684744.1 efflux RND transporter periplasmic adaptor subunit [Candidatus Rhodoblastus alkanivorans]MDI4642066.1 efflux RND transporter periplasmic adaptor subunit [Rhodoblastus acidophilus]